MVERGKGAAFLVGIDHYDDEMLPNFDHSAASNDVAVLKRLFTDIEGSQYKVDDHDQLTGSVKKDALKSELERFLSIQQYRDVLLYFSGHGYQVNKYNQGYIAASDSELSFSSKQVLIGEDNGLSFTELGNLIAHANHLSSLVLLLDTCHSGYAVSEAILKTSFQLKSGFNYYIIASSLQNQESKVDGRVGQGAFTAALIEKLSDRNSGTITADDLFNHISKKLNQSRYAQHPIIISERYQPIVLMDYPSADGKKTVQKPIYTDSSETKLKDPYQGLDAFDESTHEFFFGREAVVSDIIALFKQSDFVSVIGASGSGKSSVVKAGLFPRLLAQDSHWVLMSMKPGIDPLSTLKSLLAKELEPLLKATQAKESLQLFELDPTQDSFAQLLEQLPQAQKFLLLIDQFEETFTLASQIENPLLQKKALENQRTFLDIITTVRNPLHVVVTLRADFLEPCLNEPVLRDLIQDYAYYMPPLRGQALRDAIQSPAVRQGFDVELALVDQLELEVSSEPGALPLLEFALTQLWEKQQETGDDNKLLTLEAYNTLDDDETDGSTSSARTGTSAQATSGLQRALNSHANAVYDFSDWSAKTDERSDEQRQWIKQIFLRLIRPGEGTSDTRQRQPKASLLDIAGSAKTHAAERKQLDNLIRDLVNARLLVTGTPERSPTAEQLETRSEGQPQQWVEDNQVVDLAHETLIEGWGLFRAWRKEAQNLLRLRARIEDQRKLWEAECQDERHYLTRGLLAQVETVGWELLQPYIRSAKDVEFYTRSKAYADEQDAAEKQRAVELQQALTEAQLRLKVNDIETKLSLGRKTEALTLAIGAMGQNRERLPQKILGPVQKELGKFVDPVYPYPKMQSLGGHTDSVYAVALSGDGQTIVSGSEDQTVRVWSTDGTLLRTLEGHTAPVSSVALSGDGQTIVSGSWDNTVRVWSTDGTLLRTLEGHTDSVFSVALSGDGQTIVSGSWDNTVRVWSTDGTLLRTLEGHTDSVSSVALSGDGQTIVSGSDDKTVRVWSTDGTLLRTLEGHTDSVYAVALSGDGQTIVSGSKDKTVRVWSTDGTLLRTLEGHTDSVFSVALSGDGQTIVSGSVDETVRVWSTDGTLLRTLEGHTDSVSSVALSGDGQTIVSGSKDQTVRVWSTDGTLLRTLEGHTDSVYAVALSGDGQTIVSGSKDQTVRVWSTDGTLLRTLEGHTDSVSSVALSGDGQTIVSGSDDNTVRVWSTDGTLLRTLEGHTDSVFSVALSGDGQTIVSGSDDNTVRVWSTDGTLLRTLEGHTDSVFSVALSGDGQTIVSGSDDNTVRVWSTDGTLLRTLEGHTDSVSSVALSGDGQTIVSGSKDQTVRVWSTDGTLLRTLEGHTGAVYAVALSGDGQTIVSGSEDKTVRVWSTDGTLLRTLEGHTDSVFSVALSGDGQTIVSGSKDKTVRVWSTDGTLLRTLEGHTDSVYAVALSGDGQTIVSGSEDKTVRVWSTDGTLLRTLEGHTDSVFSVALSGDGQTIVSGSEDKTVRVWSTDGTLLRTLEGHTDSVYAVALSGDGQTIVSGSDDHTVRVWSTDGTLLRTLEGHTDSVSSVALSGDGQTIVSGSEDKTVRVWSTDGTLLRTLEGHTDSVYAVALSGDGQTIVSGSDDHTVRVWSTDGTLLRTLEGHTDSVSSVALSGDGQTIVSGSWDNTVRVWSTDGTLLRTLEGHTAPVFSVALSGDGQTIVSGSADQTVRVWPQNGWRSWLRSCLQKLGNNWTSDPEGWAARTSLFERGYLLAETQNSVDGNVLALKQFKLALQCGKPVKAAIGSQPERLSPEALETSARCLLAPILRRQGEQLARSGHYEQALDRFKQAQASGLDLDPVMEVNRFTSAALRLQGILNALQLKLEEATAKFTQAKQYDPELELEPEAEAKRIATSILVERGRGLAKDLKLEEATAQFAQAKHYDPELELEPEAEAKRIATSILVERGRGLAKDLKLEEATAQFAQAKHYDPELELEPEAEAKRIAAPMLIDQGKALLEKEQVLPDDVQQTLEAYQTAQVYDPALTITANDWNSLLWFGSLYAAKKPKLVKALLEASQEALKAEPENTGYRDTLGVAKVLAGGKRNRDSAMKDFEFYITHSNESADEKEQRQRWVNALKAGQDPFTEAEIKTLLGQ